ncbi:hypothetical protein ACJX0J_000908, partial [Zea mays]
INHLEFSEIRKKKGYVATLLKEKRIGVPEEINASHNRISIYLHYRQILFSISLEKGAQPTRTNFERGSLIDGVFNGLENLSFDILIQQIRPDSW